MTTTYKSRIDVLAEELISRATRALRKDKKFLRRFWSHVQKGRGNSCWLWNGGQRVGAYGGITFSAASNLFTTESTHRISWILAKGKIPKGKLILHSCDTPLCVRPSHLFVGTYSDNMSDMLRKGRQWQQKKTHCPHGHKYSKANTYRHKGGRYCRACQKRKTWEARHGDNIQK